MAKQTSKQHHGVGRRKTSSARVFIKPGTGKILVNQRSLEEYFPRPTLCILVRQPLKAVELENQLDILVNVQGGGVSGQAGAVRLGIARALVAYDTSTGVSAQPEGQTFKQVLRRAGLVTRDARKAERKNVGRHGSRRWKQRSKR